MSVKDNDKRVDEKDKPGGKHELVFSPETQKGGIPNGPLPLERYRTLPRFRSIRFNLWLSFVLMTLLMLIIMWIYELIFYSTIYVSFQENDMEGLGARLTENYIEGSRNNTDMTEYINDFANRYSVTIVVFSLDERGETNVKYNASVNTGVEASGLSGSLLNYFLGALTEYNVPIVSNTTRMHDISSEMVIYGIKTFLNGETEYIYMSSSLPSFGQARNTLAGQLAVVSATCILISVFVAYFGSGFAAKPMRDLTVSVMRNSGGKHEPLATDTKLAEINELSAAFNKAFDDVERNNSFRRDLLANVSHDMKTPLTMIRAYSEMIRDISGGNKEKSAKQAQVIIDETARLTALINEVIELSKLEAGVLELHPAVFDVSEKLRETVKRFSIMEETKGYVFEPEIEDELLAYADAERIDRVIYNLVGNAMNYTGADRTVKVRGFRRGGFIRVEIIDSGKGMTEEELTEVWDKYYRLAQDKRRVVGSGLGLSIVKSILDLHGATYGVESEKGKGSNFWFMLPEAK